MAPNKKKKKVASNPARGFATVSMPSKKVDESPPEPKDDPKVFSLDGRPTQVDKDGQGHGSVHRGASDLQHMAPEELERHLEEAELQSILDVHGQRSKKDISRQVARLDIERRSLRQSGMMLETEGWLQESLEEILDLARSLLPDLRNIKMAEKGVNDTDLCVKLWIVQGVLESLHFHNVEGALTHLIKTSPVITKPASSSLVWGLDEALTWLALHSDPEDLPAYQERNSRHTPPESRPRSPVSACASGENVIIPDFSSTLSYSCLPSVDDADVVASSSKPVGHAENEASGTCDLTAISDDSDDDDPDQLVDKYISAKIELLKSSLSSEANQEEQQTTDKQANKLRRRIMKIDRDVLFDRDEAMARWDPLKNDLEIEFARSNALAMRQRKRNNTSPPRGSFDTNGEVEGSESTANDDVSRGGFFGSIFASSENDNTDSNTETAVEITLRDFAPIGAGAAPRKVLEEICKSR